MWYDTQCSSQVPSLGPLLALQASCAVPGPLLSPGVSALSATLSPCCPPLLSAPLLALSEDTGRKWVTRNYRKARHGGRASPRDITVVTRVTEVRVLVSEGRTGSLALESVHPAMEARFWVPGPAAGDAQRPSHGATQGCCRAGDASASMCSEEPLGQQATAASCLPAPW